MRVLPSACFWATTITLVQPTRRKQRQCEEIGRRWAVLSFLTHSPPLSSLPPAGRGDNVGGGGVASHSCRQGWVGPPGHGRGPELSSQSPAGFRPPPLQLVVPLATGGASYPRRWRGYLPVPAHGAIIATLLLLFPAAPLLCLKDEGETGSARSLPEQQTEEALVYQRSREIGWRQQVRQGRLSRVTSAKSFCLQGRRGEGVGQAVSAEVSATSGRLFLPSPLPSLGGRAAGVVQVGGRKPKTAQR